MLEADCILTLDRAHEFFPNPASVTLRRRSLSFAASIATPLSNPLLHAFKVEARLHEVHMCLLRVQIIDIYSALALYKFATQHSLANWDEEGLTVESWTYIPP